MQSPMNNYYDAMWAWHVQERNFGEWAELIQFNLDFTDRISRRERSMWSLERINRSVLIEHP